MKKNAGSLFVRSFMKSFVIIAVLIIIGAVSYRVAVHFLNIPAAKAPEAEKDQETALITEPSIDEISKNLIYCVDDKTGEVNKILLEIFHCKNKKLTYITIPARTSFTMSDMLYRRLVPVNPAIPQIIKLSGMTKYFTKDTVYEYGVLLLEDLLKIKISYYTVIPQSLYDTMFQSEDENAGLKDEPEEEASPAAGEQPSAVTGEYSGAEDKAPPNDTASDAGTYPKEIFTDGYAGFLKGLKTADEISKYIEDTYPLIQSNLSLSGKMNYVESYSKTSMDGISFELIGGTDENSAYFIDDAQAVRQIAACTEADPD